MSIEAIEALEAAVDFSVKLCGLRSDPTVILPTSVGTFTSWYGVMLYLMIALVSI